MRILYLTVTTEWFQKIQKGEKTVDYREIKPYWIKRLMEPKGRFILTFKTWDIVRIKIGYDANAPTIDKKWGGTKIFQNGDLGRFPQFGIILEDL